MGIQYWVFSPAKATTFDVRRILRSKDWEQTKQPERNPHVVNNAVINSSGALGVHYLTYEQDLNQEVRVLYWGGDLENIEF